MKVVYPQSENRPVGWVMLASDGEVIVVRLFSHEPSDELVEAQRRIMPGAEVETMLVSYDVLSELDESEMN